MNLASCPIAMNTFFHLERKWNESPQLRPLILLAGVVAAVASPILFLADAVRWAYRSLVKGIPSTDYHYFYSTEIFSRYQEQLKEFIATELMADPALSSLALVQWIREPVHDKKAFHQGIVSRLRDLVNQKANLDQKTAGFVERFCNWVYTGPELLPAMTEWMKSHMTEAEKGSLSREAAHQVIRDLHNRWSLEPRFQGEIFQDYRSYDPRYLGDTPSHFFHVHNTQIIRTPAVTRDGERTLFGHLTRASIVEEFEGFLQHYQRHGKAHLYVNLMAPTGSEKVRNEALEDLEKRFPDGFHLITLSKDCAFYHQVGPFAVHDDAKHFKDTFIQQMFTSNAYHWPISWDSAATQAKCREAIEQIHAKHFGSTCVLNREERLRFIELAYTEIIETLLNYKSPASCNVSCRSCVDRGAANLSLLYARTQPLQESKSRETLTTIALAPAMLAQSRLMLSHRMERLSPALQQLVSRD